MDNKLEIEERLAGQTFAREFIIDFLEELQLAVKTSNLDSKTDIALTKAIKITQSFREILFNGALEFQTGISWNKGSSCYYTLTLNSDEICFSRSGSEFTEGVGGDSFYRAFYSTQEFEKYDWVRQNLKDWEEGFYAYFDEGKGLTINDSSDEFLFESLETVDLQQNILQDSTPIEFNIKRTVLLSALKVLKQVLPPSRKAQDKVMMTIVVEKNDITLTCTISKIILPCDCKGVGSCLVSILYFYRIVQDIKTKFIKCKIEGKSLQLNDNRISGSGIFLSLKNIR